MKKDVGLRHLSTDTVFEYDGDVYQKGYESNYGQNSGKTECRPKMGGKFQWDIRLAVYIPSDAIVKVDTK